MIRVCREKARLAVIGQWWWDRHGATTLARGMRVLAEFPDGETEAAWDWLRNEHDRRAEFDGMPLFAPPAERS